MGTMLCCVVSKQVRELDNLSHFLSICAKEECQQSTENIQMRPLQNIAIADAVLVTSKYYYFTQSFSYEK